MRWKRRVLEASPFHGNTHAVYMAMVMLSDWVGRLKASHIEIGRVAKLDARQVRRELPCIYRSRRVLCTEEGRGNRPAYHYISMAVCEDTLDVLTKTAVCEDK